MRQRYGEGGHKKCRTNRKRGWEQLVHRAQASLHLCTKKEAESIVDTVISCIEETLLHNLDTDGFSLKLNSLGKFVVRHRPAMCRKIGFSSETRRMKPKRKVRFTSLGRLRQLEPVD
jgi:nucleoid DNA-binding protein